MVFVVITKEITADGAQDVGGRYDNAQSRQDCQNGIKIGRIQTAYRPGQVQ